ncbi:MAG: hypothetical protein KDK27_17900, partial [Leptospiraceae bacterium]|nr:hypothetical protein [Leptospiraceae bacterium]
ASQDARNEYQQAFDVFMKGEHIVEITSELPGSETFGSHSKEVVGSFVVQQTWYVQATRKINLFNALKALFGRVPVAIVVFPNGDVAKFKATPTQSYSTCCEYIPGTARNRNGEFIGPGTSNGEDYVRPYGGGGGPSTNQNWGVIIDSPGRGSGICGRVNNGPLDCLET